MSTATTYKTGDIKQDPATKAVAVRRGTPADGPMAWGVITPDGSGGSYRPYSDIKDWVDKNTSGIAAANPKAGAIRQNPETLAVAVRCANSADSPRAWGVMTIWDGGHYTSAEDVKDWADRR